MKTLVPQWALPIGSIAAVWASCFLLYYASLALNNHFRLLGAMLPQVAVWVINISKFRITFGAATVFSILILYLLVKRRDPAKALAWACGGLLLFLVVTWLIITGIVVSCGQYMCDEWKKWDHGKSNEASHGTALPRPPERGLRMSRRRAILARRSAQLATLAPERYGRGEITGKRQATGI